MRPSQAVRPCRKSTSLSISSTLARIHSRGALLCANFTLTEMTISWESTLAPSRAVRPCRKSISPKKNGSPLIDVPSRGARPCARLFYHSTVPLLVTSAKVPSRGVRPCGAWSSLLPRRATWKPWRRNASSPPLSLSVANAQQTMTMPPGSSYDAENETTMRRDID